VRGRGRRNPDQRAAAIEPAIAELAVLCRFERRIESAASPELGGSYGQVCRPEEVNAARLGSIASEQHPQNELAHLGVDVVGERVCEVAS